MAKKKELRPKTTAKSTKVKKDVQRTDVDDLKELEDLVAKLRKGERVAFEDVMGAERACSQVLGKGYARVVGQQADAVKDTAVNAGRNVKTGASYVGHGIQSGVSAIGRGFVTIGRGLSDVQKRVFNGVGEAWGRMKSGLKNLDARINPNSPWSNGFIKKLGYTEPYIRQYADGISNGTINPDKQTFADYYKGVRQTEAAHYRLEDHKKPPFFRTVKNSIKESLACNGVFRKSDNDKANALIAQEAMDLKSQVVQVAPQLGINIQSPNQITLSQAVTVLVASQVEQQMRQQRELITAMSKRLEEMKMYTSQYATMVDVVPTDGSFDAKDPLSDENKTQIYGGPKEFTEYQEKHPEVAEEASKQAVAVVLDVQDGYYSLGDSEEEHTESKQKDPVQKAVETVVDKESAQKADSSVSIDDKSSEKVVKDAEKTVVEKTASVVKPTTAVIYGQSAEPVVSKSGANVDYSKVSGVDEKGSSADEYTDAFGF